MKNNDEFTFYYPQKESRVKSFKELTNSFILFIEKLIEEYGNKEKQMFNPGIINHIIPDEIFEIFKKT